MRSAVASRRLATLLACALARPATASAQAEGGGARQSAAPFEERLVLEVVRPPPPPPDPDSAGFSLRGEYQLRYRAMNDLPLEAPKTDPGATTLGQNQLLLHWLRLEPRFRYGDRVAIVAQIDALRGLIVGDTTRHVDKVRDAYAVASWYEVHPRYLYLEVSSPIGLFRLGQQGAHWGMGLLANDGEHRSLFGDYQRGMLVDRVLFAAAPLGKDGPLTVALAGDLVFEDNDADLLGDDIQGQDPRDGDRAFQGVASALWREPRGALGLYAVVRRQDRERLPTGALTPFTEVLTAGILDLTGSWNAEVPGGDAYVYGELEAALVLGSTTYARSRRAPTLEPAPAHAPEALRSFGGAATFGAVHVAGRGPRRWGWLVTEVELGYASGDADPFDGTRKRFTFDPNHNVGLVLFDHVLAWKTARAATLARDPRLVARPEPGIQALPSKGGVFGAAYVNPRIVVRPERWLDLKAGAVLAQTTADLVDPYRASALGAFANYDGGDVRRHDLGGELDLGLDARVATGELAVIQLGAEGGVLFPGGAFDDAKGEGMPEQYLLNLKLGVVY